MGGRWKFSRNFSSLALSVWGVKVFWRYCRKGWLEKLINDLQKCLQNSPGYTGSVKKHNGEVFLLYIGVKCFGCTWWLSFWLYIVVMCFFLLLSIVVKWLCCTMYVVGIVLAVNCEQENFHQGVIFRTSKYVEPYYWSNPSSLLGRGQRWVDSIPGFIPWQNGPAEYLYCI